MSSTLSSPANTFSTGSKEKQECIAASVLIKIQGLSSSVGLAVFDQEVKCLHISEFQDDTYYSSLEAGILQTRPSRVILTVTPIRAPSAAIHIKKIRDIIDAANVTAMPVNFTQAIEGMSQDFESSSQISDACRGTPTIGVDAEASSILNVSQTPQTASTSGREAASEVLEVDLRRLLRPWDDVRNHQAELSMKLGCAAANILICKWELMQDESNHKQCTLGIHQLSSFVSLDKGAYAALSILPPLNCASRQLSMAATSGWCPRGGNEATSVFGLLNRCRTTIGSRKLSRWIRQPLIDIDAIRQRHNIVDVFLSDTSGDILQTLQGQYLRRIPDLDNLVAKFHRVAGQHLLKADKWTISKSLAPTLEHLSKLYDCIVQSHALLTFLRSSSLSSLKRSEKSQQNNDSGSTHSTSKSLFESLDELILSPLEACLKHLDGYLKLAEHSLEEDPTTHPPTHVINRKLDDELSRLAAERSDVWDKIETHRKQVQTDLGMDDGETFRGGRKRSSVGSTSSSSYSESVKIVELLGMGRVFRVTKKDQQKVQAQPNKYKKVRINKAEFQFTTEKLKNYCEQFEAITKKVDTRQGMLINKVVAVASTYWPVVEKLADILSTLDTLAAFAQVALWAPKPYCRPVICEAPFDDEIDLRQCRHPLAEQCVNKRSYVWMSKSANDKTDVPQIDFISNDIYMSRKNGSWLQVITGPNMGGKSTYIRQVALAALMCQIGSWIPCSYGKLPLFTQIICRIGASDMQMKGVSTFYAEMIEASAICRTAKKSSLVIVDELGRGTSTHEGLGIAWGVAQHIATRSKAFCLFATHFHELAALSSHCEGVVNKHVAVEVVCNPPHIDSESPISVAEQEDKNNGKRLMKDLVFLYEVRDGASDKSYGLAVGEMAKLPLEVLERAKLKSIELESEGKCVRLCGDSKEKISGAMSDEKENGIKMSVNG